MNTLLLRLEGPLQSWGLRARWEERDSAFEPTKSGVIGLLGCALGLRRADDRLRALSEALAMGVRVDRPGKLLVDYHTTGGAKAADGKPEGMFNAEGKLKRETDISYRRYLMDASFLVALRSDDAALIEELTDAVQNPVWPYFLGRKACVPSVPVFAGTGNYDLPEAALRDSAADERRSLARGAAATVRLVIECRPGEGSPRNDAIGVPARRLFWPRYAREIFVPVPAPDIATPGRINTLEG